MNEYLKYLVPAEETSSDSVVSSQSANVISRSSLKLLSLVDQVRCLLRDGMLELRERWAECCISDGAYGKYLGLSWLTLVTVVRYHSDSVTWCSVGGCDALVMRRSCLNTENAEIR